MNQLNELILLIKFTEMNRFSDLSQFNELFHYKYSDKTELRHE
jgi:hypothetical protein